MGRGGTEAMYLLLFTFCQASSKTFLRQQAGGSGGRKYRLQLRLPQQMLDFSHIPRFSPSRFMQANLALRKGLGAVVGLNFDTLAPALQIKMMRPMTITRHKKVHVGPWSSGSY